MDFWGAVLMLVSPLSGVPCSALVTVVGRVIATGVMLAVDATAANACGVEVVVAPAVLAVAAAGAAAIGGVSRHRFH